MSAIVDMRPKNSFHLAEYMLNLQRRQQRAGVRWTSKFRCPLAFAAIALYMRRAHERSLHVFLYRKVLGELAAEVAVTSPRTD